MPSTAIVASQILDSGLTGRQLVQSATKSEAITVLGLDPSNYALLDSSNTFTGRNTFDDDVTVNALLSAGSAEFGSVTINDDFFASNAEFSGSVEFTDLITGVGGEHQGDLRITDADLIVSGTGKIDAVDGDFSGTFSVPADGLIQNVVGVSGDTDRAYLQNHTFTDAATGTVSVWSKLYTEGVYDNSNPFLTQWRMGLDGSYNLLFDKQGILFQNNGSLQGGFFQADYADPKIGFIGVGQTSDLGLETYRWQQSWLEDVSFDGTIYGEVGGSYKLYNLGIEGDADTEYIETSCDTNQYNIQPKATGTGVTRKIQIGLPTANNITVGGTAANLGSLRYGTSDRLIWGASYVAVLSQFRPFSDNTYECGTSSFRWSNVASVDGDFSGTVTAPNFDVDSGQQKFYNAGSLRMGIGGGGVYFYSNQIPNSAHTLGLVNKRWANVYSEDGSFSGNLNVEPGGSYKIYNLGTEGDADTEFISMGWATNDFEITADKTGTGTVQDIDISGNQVALRHNNGSSISTRLSVDSSSVKVWRNMFGGSDGLYSCGTTTNRWANVASVDGDFSGTVTAIEGDFSGAVTGSEFKFAGDANTRMNVQGSDWVAFQIGGFLVLDMLASANNKVVRFNSNQNQDISAFK